MPARLGGVKVAWWFLIAAGGFEIIMALCLKYSNGWSRVAPSVGGIIAAAFSMGLLTMALKTLPVSTGYAIWTGIGALGVTLVGIIYFHENASPVRLFCLGLLFAGMLGLRFFKG